jgi:ATP adenylyltransferase
MNDNILWAPWRSEFVLAEKEAGCIFCNRIAMEDSIDNLIVHRGGLNMVILNKFPYNSGHTMVVPLRHIAHLEDLTPAESVEFFELTRRTVAVIKGAINPHSLNIGMNLGESSGAGIPEHLHLHIVPRWNGDTNFMPVISQTAVVSVPLGPVYDALRRGFESA